MARYRNDTRGNWGYRGRRQPHHVQFNSQQQQQQWSHGEYHPYNNHYNSYGNRPRPNQFNNHYRERRVEYNRHPLQPVPFAVDMRPNEAQRNENIYHRPEVNNARNGQDQAEFTLVNEIEVINAIGSCVNRQEKIKAGGHEQEIPDSNAIRLNGHEGPNTSLRIYNVRENNYTGENKEGENNESLSEACVNLNPWTIDCHKVDSMHQDPILFKSSSIRHVAREDGNFVPLSNSSKNEYHNKSVPLSSSPFYNHRYLTWLQNRQAIQPSFFFLDELEKLFETRPSIKQPIEFCTDEEKEPLIIYESENNNSSKKPCESLNEGNISNETITDFEETIQVHGLTMGDQQTINPNRMLEAGVETNNYSETASSSLQNCVNFIRSLASFFCEKNNENEKDLLRQELLNILSGQASQEINVTDRLNDMENRLTALENGCSKSGSGLRVIPTPLLQPTATESVVPTRAFSSKKSKKMALTEGHNVDENLLESTQETTVKKVKNKKKTMDEKNNDITPVPTKKSRKKKKSEEENNVVGTSTAASTSSRESSSSAACSSKSVGSYCSNNESFTEDDDYAKIENNSEERKHIPHLEMPLTFVQDKDDDYVEVYTDGACLGNGMTNARAGVGVWFGDDHPLNISEPIDCVRATNNSAEIQAARLAINEAFQAGVKKLRIFTDSKFLKNCATKWMAKWKSKGWRRDNGMEVKNKTELKKLDRMLTKPIAVDWRFIPAHSGVYGNEMAHKLATEGAKRDVIVKQEPRD